MLGEAKVEVGRLVRLLLVRMLIGAGSVLSRAKFVNLELIGVVTACIHHGERDPGEARRTLIERVTFDSVEWDGESDEGVAKLEAKRVNQERGWACLGLAQWRELVCVKPGVVVGTATNRDLRRELSLSGQKVRLQIRPRK